jgi:hypothetical protein
MGGVEAPPSTHTENGRVSPAPPAWQAVGRLPRPDQPGYWGKRSASWRQAVLVRATAVSARLTCPGHVTIQPGPGPDPALELVEAAAQSARERNTLGRWWQGTLLERSWMCLHEAEAMLAERESTAVLRARLPGLLAAAETVLTCTDRRLLAAREIDRGLAAAPTPAPTPAPTQAPTPTTPPGTAAAASTQPGAAEPDPAGSGKPADPAAVRPTAGELAQAELDARGRHQVGELIRAIYGVWDERYARSRNFRNRLIRTFLVLSAAVLGLVLLSALAGHTPEFCGLRPASAGEHAIDSCPSHHAAPDTSDLALVLIFGAVGGLLGALPALARMSGSWNRFGLPSWQAALKIPTGALTGLLGALLLNAGIAQLSPTASPAALLVTALGFGAGQQAVTRYVDRHTESLLAATPTDQERKQLASTAPATGPRDAPDLSDTGPVTA